MKSNGLLMKASIGILVSLLLVSLLASCAQPEASTEVIEFTYATDETPTHERYTDVVIPFQRRIENQTNHRVRITSFPAESLVAADDMFDAVVTGSIDMGDANTSYTPGRFQLTEAVGIPGLGFADPYIATMSTWDLYKEFPEVQAESAGMKVFWFWALPAPYIYSNKPIRTLADLQGMKIRSYPGPSFDAMKLLGAVPVDISWPDIYEAMERKTIDAFIANMVGIVPMKFYEVSTYATNFNLGGMANWGGMNIDVYNGLPQDIQKVIDDATGDVLVAEFANMLQEYDGRMEAEAARQGLEIITLDPAEHEKWTQIIQPVPAKWAADMEAKGLPGTEIVEFVKDRFAYYSR